MANIEAEPSQAPHRALRLRDWPILLIAALIGLGVLGVGVAALVNSTPPDGRRIVLQVDASAAAVPLIDANGRQLTWGALNGAPRAVFFGFTRCPEICPTTVAALSSAFERLGPRAQNLRVDFVSVDPTRDTPDLLKAYFASVGPRFHGYTGTEANIAKLAHAYHVFYQRVPTSGGDYTLDHSAIVYLLNARGEVVDFVTYNTPPDRLAEQLDRLVSL